MKPASIRRFDVFYLAWVALTVIDFFLQRDAYVAQVDAAARGSGAMLGSSFVIVIFVIWVLFMLLLWWLVSARHSVIAKWIIVLLTIIGVFGVPDLFRHGLTTPVIVALLMLVASVGAAYSLFTPGAKAWFARTTPVEPGTDD